MDSELVRLTLPDGRVLEVPKGERLERIASELRSEDNPIVAFKVNNNIQELHKPVTESGTLEPIDLTSDDGQRIYERSLVFILIKSAREVLPGCRVTIEHSLGNGLYGEIHTDPPLKERDIEVIEARMRECVEADLPFVKQSVPKEKALDLFARDGQMDKVRVLKYRKRDTVNVYTCDWFSDYFYGYMVPSSGYLKKFKLRFYLPGFILQIPSKHNPKVIAPYVEQPKFARVFREAERWGEILEVDTVGALNDMISSGKAGDIVRIAEAFHEKKIAQIADLIAENRDTLRVILIAGPSSSGKTTFAQRLSIQLRVNGLKPVSISLDDYFLDRELTPIGEDGQYDFEAIEAIDLRLFNEDLTELIQGNPVSLPTFNFVTGKREYRGRTLQISHDQPLIIEGIHGLNDRLTASIPHNNKFKVYVSALTQLNIDDHNRIPTTDLRIIRRIVRDHQFRSHPARETIRRWPSVRRGEQKNIFPFQEDADVMFNSSLAYELAVLKPYAEPLLHAIDRSYPEYSEAKRLAKFLDYFLPLEPTDVPATSILREFIGGSSFRDNG